MRVEKKKRYNIKYKLGRGYYKQHPAITQLKIFSISQIYRVWTGNKPQEKYFIQFSQFLYIDIENE